MKLSKAGSTILLNTEKGKTGGFDNSMSAFLAFLGGSMCYHPYLIFLLQPV